MLTMGGYIKKTALSAFSNIRANGLKAIVLEEGDQLRWVRLAHPEDGILIGSRQGMTIHFQASHDQLRPLGRSTRGVRSMSLKGDDALISMDILSAQVTAAVPEARDTEPDTELEDEVSEVDNCDQGPWVLVIAASGLGKRVPVSNFRKQNRAGMGLVGMKFRKNDDELVALRVVNPDEELMLVTARGIIIRQAICAISVQSRMATGVQLQRLDDDDEIAAVAIVPQPPEETETLTELVEEIVDTLGDVTAADVDLTDVDAASSTASDAPAVDDAADSTMDDNG